MPRYKNSMSNIEKKIPMKRDVNGADFCKRCEGPILWKKVRY